MGAAWLYGGGKALSCLVPVHELQLPQGGYTNEPTG